ncbi:MAG: GntR family transcriptional regulator [Rhodospirillaceae bacterium]|mgnify:CR=1 FL=1|nr:GntR family transcriptional regulator [Rhodospirillaceae bacterium]|tara:strand:- start:568 stop:1359 length:792 start_codon:yes stop_codon:yes gene_type:complete
MAAKTKADKMARSARASTGKARAARLKREPGKPLYAQVEEIIRRRLIDNYWKPGEMLPSEFELAHELSVSQGTVRKALNDMVSENLLERRQGRGTFVSEYTERRALFFYFNLIGPDGVRAMPVSKILACEQRNATEDERNRLQLAIGDSVIALHRVRSLGDSPAIVERLTLPQKFFPGLGNETRLPENLYRFFQGEYGITVAKATESVRAVAADPLEAQLLSVMPEAPLLEIDRVAVTIDGRPVEWRLSRCNTSDYRYVAERG